MDNEFIPICGCLQYPHVDLELRHNPEMDVSQIIAYHLTALMASYPERETLAKVAKAAKVGFGTVQRARNGDGNLTVQNLALIAAAFHRRPEVSLLSQSTNTLPMCRSRRRLFLSPQKTRATFSRAIETHRKKFGKSCWRLRERPLRKGISRCAARKKTILHISTAHDQGVQML